MTIFTWNINTIVHSTVDVNCGSPTLIFMDQAGFSISLIFTINDLGDGNFSLTVFTDDISFGGYFTMSFIFYYSGMPSVNIYSSVFVVIIVNPCIPPPGCIGIPGCGILPPTVVPPSIDISIEVTITIDIDYELPPWHCGTPGCDTQIEPICVDCIICCHGCNCGDGGDSTGTVVVIVENHINILIESCGDICGSDPGGTTYIIIIDGCIGGICSPVECEVIIYNPCLDASLFLVTPIQVPDFECVLYDHGCQFQHESFFVNTSITAAYDICGPLIYTIDAGDLNIFIEYDVELHIIVIYCEDMSLVVTGSFTYTITVSLSMHPTCGGCWGHSTGTIVILSPCIGPQLTVGLNINIDFSFNGPSSWTPPPLSVVPSVCFPHITYVCNYVSGPYTGPIDLCNWTSGPTQCPEGTYWSTDACMCLAEIQCAMMCQPGQQLDPRYGCDCIPQTQYNAIMANCDTPYCDDGYYWSTDACMCFAEIQCAMMCIPG
jgi:hypothetical protein